MFFAGRELLRFPSTSVVVFVVKNDDDARKRRSSTSVVVVFFVHYERTLWPCSSLKTIITCPCEQRVIFDIPGI